MGLPLSTLVDGDEQSYWPSQQATQSMDANVFCFSFVCFSVLEWINHWANPVVHLLLLKFSMGLRFGVCQLRKDKSMEVILPKSKSGSN